MLTQQFTLPKWNFVGGKAQTRSFNLQKPNGKVYDIPRGTARLAIVDFVNSDTAPVLLKETSVTANADGMACVVSFSLTQKDTLALEGKYIYQVTVKDGNGNAIPRQGSMIVTKHMGRDLWGTGTLPELTNPATAEQILVTYEAINGDGDKLTGSMPNNGAIAGMIDGLAVTSFAIPAGYTSGGTVSLTNDIEAALAAI